MSHVKFVVKTSLILAIVLSSQVFAKSAFSSKLLSSRFSSWGINPSESASINILGSWQTFQEKNQVIVAVIDTGIQHNHPFLKENIYVPSGKVSSSNFGIDFSTGSKTLTPNDSHGHGTHVSGIVKSIYPNVKILPLKYYNPNASGHANLKATIKALEYAVDANVDIINYSGGGPEPSSEELRILKKAEKKGILIIAAAGNERSNIDIRKNAYYPASYGLSNIITVAAYNQKEDIIPSSNYGKTSVDIVAPGYRIRSSIPDNGAGYMTGTSQATAFVTGVAALIKSQYPKLNFGQIKNIVVSSAKKNKKFSEKIISSGKLDATNALKKATEVYTKLYSKEASRGVARKKELRKRIKFLR
jgi:thermitase